MTLLEKESGVLDVRSKMLIHFLLPTDQDVSLFAFSPALCVHTCHDACCHDKNELNL